MVLGVILYETVDLGISAIKLTYRGLRASYYWWYDMEYPEVERENRKIKDMEELTKKLERLEKILENKQD
jgi:hypothetical protein